MADALLEQPCIEVANSLDRPLLHDLEEAGPHDTPDSSPGVKRLRCSEAIPPSPSVKRYTSLGLQLYIRMDTMSGRSRMHATSLRRVQDVHDLEVGTQQNAGKTARQARARHVIAIGFLVIHA
jgi:hypothetical protein